MVITEMLNYISANKQLAKEGHFSVYCRCGWFCLLLSFARLVSKWSHLNCSWIPVISHHRSLFSMYLIPCYRGSVHRWRQNIIRTKSSTRAVREDVKMWQEHQWMTRLSPCVTPFCSRHILTSSVISYWTDTQQHGIHFLNRS